MSTLSHFGGLDELIQVIYQGPYRFCVLSKVDDDAWTISLGLSGHEGRWWQGKWSEKDVLDFTGSKSSGKVLRAFSDKLHEAFVQGEVVVGNWSSEKGATINLTLGPASENAVHIPLVELSPEGASSHATSVFLDIALQAQSRKCQLNPPSFISSRASPRGTSPAKAEVAAVSSTASTSTKGTTKPKALISGKEQEEIKQLKVQLAKAQKKAQVATAGESSSKTAPTKRPPKGASLANPNKKARKYQALEFESDEE